MIKVKFIEHSGFAVETDNSVYIFDYYDPKNRHDILSVADGKKTYVFVSHSHPDHYDKKIFNLRNKTDVMYVISDDVKAVQGDDIRLVKPDMRYVFDDVEVKTFKSTDEGVAFIVYTEGMTIYHAGDLNWWHWNGETDDYNNAMARDYMAEINKMRGIEIDIAFVPLDPRLEDKYFWGMDYALNMLDIKKAFPMHLWGKYGLSRMLKADSVSEKYRDKIIDIDKDEQIFFL